MLIVAKLICGCTAVAAAVGPTTCTGLSKNLPAEQCAAWAEFFDAVGLADSSMCERDRNDPCNCPAGPEASGVCDKTHAVITSIAFGFAGLSGTLPASMVHLRNLSYFNVAGNALTGPLPDLPWGNHDFHGDIFDCLLYTTVSDTRARTNAFDCPLPSKVLELPCMLVSSHGVRAVTANDCGPAPPPAPKAKKYTCTNSKCEPHETGVSQKKCEQACG